MWNRASSTVPTVAGEPGTAACAEDASRGVWNPSRVTRWVPVVLAVVLSSAFSLALLRRPRAEAEPSPRLFRIHGVAPGMSREEVIEALGEPNLATVLGGPVWRADELLMIYDLGESDWAIVYLGRDEVVRMVSGSRVSLGGRTVAGPGDRKEDLVASLGLSPDRQHAPSGLTGLADESGMYCFVLVRPGGWTSNLGLLTGEAAARDRMPDRLRSGKMDLLRRHLALWNQPEEADDRRPHVCP